MAMRDTSEALYQVWQPLEPPLRWTDSPARTAWRADFAVEGNIDGNASMLWDLERHLNWQTSQTPEAFLGNANSWTSPSVSTTTGVLRMLRSRGPPPLSPALVEDYISLPGSPSTTTCRQTPMPSIGTLEMAREFSGTSTDLNPTYLPRHGHLRNQLDRRGRFHVPMWSRPAEICLLDLTLKRLIPTVLMTTSSFSGTAPSDENTVYEWDFETTATATWKKPTC